MDISGAGSIVKSIAGIFTANTRRKQAKESGIQKILQAQVDGGNSLNMSDAEWEAVNASKADSSWKDEYVTVVCTSPYVLIIIGAVANAFGAPEILQGAMTGIQKLQDIEIDVGEMVKVVVYAAVGLKLWRGR